MQIGPLVTHAAARLPALTDLFSDPLAISSMAVTAGGSVVLTTAAPHGVASGRKTGLCVVDAETPNPVTALVVGPGDTVTLTLAHAHNLLPGLRPTALTGWGAAYMGGPDANLETTVTLAGFTDPGLNGVCQLVDVPARDTIVVMVRSTLVVTALNGGEALLERLEEGLIGWHAATATGAATLSFPAPGGIDRSFTVGSPKVVRNVRIAGALDREVVGAQYVRGYQSNIPVEAEESLAQSWVFIVPQRTAKLSKDRNAATDATAEITPAASYSQMLVDGFEVLVLLPAKDSSGGVACADLAHGPILRAVLRTFHGLKTHRPELATNSKLVALLTEHGAAAYDRATYMHAYSFEASAFLTNEDAVQPFEWTAVYGPAPDGPAGGYVPPDSAPPIGSLVVRDIVLGPDPDGGIRHDQAPSPLTALVPLD